MNLSEPFIARPVATTLLTLGVALAGWLGFLLLPVAPLPQVEFPTITVQASLPGASPETIAATVATPLERALGRIAGITEMTSSSSAGSTRITLQFDLDRNIDGAARDVQAAISAARALLPTGMPANPTYRKVNPADSPIVILSLTSDTKSPGEMYDAASTILAQKLSQLSGVGQVSVGGSSLPAVRIAVNPTALNNYGIALEDVRTAIATTNANRPKGSVESDTSNWQIYANDQAKTAREYLPLVVAFRNGAGVRLGDVAQVTDSVQDVRNEGIANGRSAVLVIIYRQPGANIIDVVNRITAELPRLRASIPRAIDLSVAMERTSTIRASLREAERTLLISLGLVILVVFLFLRSARATLIPSLAVPISIIGTFGVMYLAGQSLDNLSLMALIVATGFVVDDAIVVLENIARHVEGGMAPRRAALLGASEVGFTVLSMSLSLIAVFIPILFMGGIIGRYFREFALVLSTAITISLVVSLTTTPMLCSRWLRPRSAERPPGRLARTGEAALGWLLHGYERSLGWALRHHFIVLLILFATIAFNIWLYTIVPKGFFPQQDTGRLTGAIQADQSISFQAMRQKIVDFTTIILRDPAVDTVVVFTGGGQRNTGFMFVVLKDLAQRKVSADEVIRRLRPKLAREPGASLFLQPVQDIRVGGRPANAQFQYTLQADDLSELREWEPKLRQALTQLPQLADVNTDQQDRGLQTTLDFDRPTAARLGVTPRAIDAMLNDAFGQRLVSVIYAPLNQYYVVLEAGAKYLESPASLDQFNVPSAINTASVPLNAISRYRTTLTALAVNHQGQFAASTISFNLAPNVSLGQATKLIGDTLQKIGAPATVTGGFQGTAKAFQDSLSNQPVLILSALVAIYLVLGILYESYVHPITILSTLPSAGVGAILALLATGVEFSVIAMIGVILLIGIVKKNAIMMIDFALEAQRTSGSSPTEAIFEACLLRFRPIMMTTMAALLGAVPLAIGSGDGSEFRRPLGISIVGGLIVSQMLTLYTTPVVYLYMDRLRARFARKRRTR